MQRSHRSQPSDILSLSITLRSFKCLKCLEAKTPALKVLRAADITLCLRQLNLHRSGVIQPCDGHELCPIAPLGKADDPVDVSPHVARGMVQHDELKAAFGVQSNTPHHLERLSYGVHIFVPQLGLVDLLVFLLFRPRNHALRKVHLAWLVEHKERRDWASGLR